MKNVAFIITLLLTTTILTFGQLKVATNGYVGMGGITNPQEKVHVNGNVILTHGSSYKAYRTGGQSHNVLRLDNNNDFVFNFSSLQNFGNLPSSALMIVGNNKFYDIRNASNQTMVRVDESNGFMGVNTASPAANFHVNGTAVKPGGGSWGAASDKRLKNNINIYEDGLTTLMKVNPVTFQYNGKGGISTGDKEFVGVIAQELKQAAPYMVETFKHEEKDEDGKILSSEEYLMVDPSALTYMLINAVQEQQDIITNLQERITQLERSTTKDAYKTETDISIKGAGQLAQNMPNPFTENTIIRYELSDKNADATIQIFSLKGELLKTIPADGTTGQVNLELTDMPAGTYMYSLVVDGKIIDTKKMLLTK